MAQHTSPPNATTAFDRVLDDFKRDLTDDEINKYYGTSLKDLKANIAAIQAKQRKTKTMQNLTRLQGFLEAMESYSKVLDVFVNVSDFVAFIWGPMKFLLLTASAFSQAFGGLLDAYKSIAENLPLLEQYEALFGTDDRVQCVLEVTLRDVFEFHRMALKYFRKPTWRQVFHATWNTFNTSVGVIIESLRGHRELLVNQASLEHFRRVEAERHSAAQRFDLQQEQENTWKMTHLLTWLSAVDVRRYQEQGVQAREGDTSSCRWILNKDSFRAWCEPQTAEPLLWIHGKPGVGKSVLASLIVEEAERLPSIAVLYFYCRHGDPERNSFVAMARSLLWQLLAKDNGFIDLMFQASTDSKEVQLNTQKTSDKLLGTALKLAGRTCIILDGLDECSDLEQKHIAKWLLQYVEKSGSGRQASRCVFLSQHDATTKSLLSRLPVLYFGQSDNSADLERFCARWARRIQEDFSQDTSFAATLSSDVARYSSGMFLYARLVMHHLSLQTNLHDLQNEMRPELFPTELNDVYARILQRVLDLADKSRQQDALQTFTWLLCAIRPLTWEEIQAAFCIDAQQQRVDHDRRRRVDITYLCGALVGVDQNGEIELVHSTTKTYLTSTYIDISSGHLSMVSLGLDYFCFPIFDHNLTDYQIDQHIVSGAYGLLDYVIVNWTTHLERGLKALHAIRPSLGQLEGTLQRFYDLHWQSPREKSSISKQLLDPVKTFQRTDLQEKVLKTLASMHKLTSAEIQDISPYATLDLIALLFRIRDRMELLAENGPDDHSITLKRFYGSSLFKCSRLYCKWFHQGFDDFQKRQAHKEKHDRSFYCPNPGCYAATIGCTTKKDLESHIRSYHTVQDEFPPEASRQSDEMTASRKDNVERSRRFFRCHLCPKFYTRRYTLRSHMHTHSDKSSLTCTVCGKAFSQRYKYQRHILLHRGTSKFVCRGLLTNGDEWGCGRQFARAGGLGIHFRTLAGRVCIRPLVDQESAERQKTLEEGRSQAVEQSQNWMGNSLPVALIRQYPALAPTFGHHNRQSSGDAP